MLKDYELFKKHPKKMLLPFQTSEGFLKKFPTYGGYKKALPVQTSRGVKNIFQKIIR